jgi:hypothetical protein
MILAISCLVLVLGSCKKAGCTNARAYNYDPSARLDDGSCLYCDSTVIDSLGFSSGSLSDFNYSSLYYGQTVLFYTGILGEKNYTGNGCKQKGYNTNNGCVTLNYRAILQNQTPKTMFLSGVIVVSTNSQIINHSLYSVSIPPYGTTTVYLGSSCELGIFFNFNMQNFTFTYQ